MPEIPPELSDLTPLTEQVIGAAIEVHRELGPGFLEKTYASALAIELRKRNINFTLEHPVELLYKGESIGQGRLDLLIENQLILELKAVDRLIDIHTAPNHFLSESH